MATVIYLSGKAEWAMVRRPDEAFGDKFYKITLDLDSKSKKVYEASGLQLEPRLEDGGYRLTFRRQTSKAWPDGNVEDLGPPKIFDTDGTTELASDVLIGNGSEVCVKVETFDGRKGKGHRLVAIRVDKLIPYTLPEVNKGF